MIHIIRNSTEITGVTFTLYAGAFERPHNVSFKAESYKELQQIMKSKCHVTKNTLIIVYDKHTYAKIQKTKHSKNYIAEVFYLQPYRIITNGNTLYNQWSKIEIIPETEELLSVFKFAKL